MDHDESQLQAPVAATCDCRARRPIHLGVLLLFVVLALLAYANTFNVPPHFDDYEVAFGLSFDELLLRSRDLGRIIPWLTFVLNRQVHGNSVFGYHLLNLVVHIGVAYATFALLWQTLRTKREDAADASPWRDPAMGAALAAALFFLLHPLATQAVTYITQRYTSIAALFYVASIFFYVRARRCYEDGGRAFWRWPHAGLYALSFGAGLAAMFSKEYAVSLPLMLVLAEYYLCQQDFASPGRRLLYLAPAAATCSVPIGLHVLRPLLSAWLAADGGAAAAGGDLLRWAPPALSRSVYFCTQAKVVLGVYLRLILVPLGQNIDHQVAVVRTPLSLEFLVFGGLAAALVVRAIWVGRQRPLLAFGVLWFFVALAPTSSVVTNTEFVAEHRAYLPMIGLCFVAADLFRRVRRRALLVGVLLPLLCLLGVFTHRRNRLWQDELLLWQDAVRKSPGLPRPYLAVGSLLERRGRHEQALPYYQKALELNPRYEDAWNNLGDVYQYRGDFGSALAAYEKALELNPAHAKALNNTGLVYSKTRRYEEAIEVYRRALEYAEFFVEAHYNLAMTLEELGRQPEAAAHYSKALKIRPEYAEAHYNLGLIHYRAGRLEEAAASLTQAAAHRPGHARTYMFLGEIFARLERVEALGAYRQALDCPGPHLGEAHFRLAELFRKAGRDEPAQRHAEAAKANGYQPPNAE